jgi:hypothetical protein
VRCWCCFDVELLALASLAGWAELELGAELRWFLSRDVRDELDAGQLNGGVVYSDGKLAPTTFLVTPIY